MEESSANKGKLLPADGEEQWLFHSVADRRLLIILMGREKWIKWILGCRMLQEVGPGS